MDQELNRMFEEGSSGKAHSTVIHIGFASCHGIVDTEGLKRFIDESDGDFDTFELAPAKPGEIRAAAIDYVIVLGAVGSVASIASLLWKAYDKFIAPKKKSQHNNAGLAIYIQKPDGKIISFFVGKEYKDKDIFIQDFIAKVSDIHGSKKNPEFFNETEAEIRYTGFWIKRR